MEASYEEFICQKEATGGLAEIIAGVLSYSESVWPCVKYILPKLYDEEFAPVWLAALKKREILGRSNPVNYVPLIYDLWTKAEKLDTKYQLDRKDNPLLETTPIASWLVAEISPAVRKVRPNPDLDDDLLVKALTRYFQRKAPHQVCDRTEDGEQKLQTSIQPYSPAIKNLFERLVDRHKSLGAILGLTRSAYSNRRALLPPVGSTKREKIFLDGILNHWTNVRIARELDNSGLKSHSREYKSYKDILRNNPQLFYSLKSSIKMKYSGKGRVGDLK